MMAEAPAAEDIVELSLELPIARVVREVTLKSLRSGEWHRRSLSRKPPPPPGDGEPHYSSHLAVAEEQGEPDEEEEEREERFSLKSAYHPDAHRDDRFRE